MKKLILFLLLFSCNHIVVKHTEPLIIVDTLTYDGIVYERREGVCTLTIDSIGIEPCIILK